jgi:ribosomal protein L32E
MLFPKATRGLEPIGYRGALLSTLLHATVYMFLHNLLNVLVQIANKMGLQKKKCICGWL